MKSILIIGGSHSDQPLIESAILRGLKVYTTGNRPDHPGHRLAHGYIPADFSKPDNILAVAQKLQIDFVVPGANDFAMISAAYVAETMSLPGFDSVETTKLLHHKDSFKEYANSRIPVCRHVILRPDDSRPIAQQLESLVFPLIVKPIDLTGGKGISQVNHITEVYEAIVKAQRLSRSKTVIVEEKFEGSLHSYSTVIENGHIVFEYLDTELCLFHEYLVSTSMSVCELKTHVIDKVRKATYQLIHDLSLVNGVLHCQFLSDGEEVRILEYTRRMSGDLYSKVVQMVTGVRHSDIFIAAACGEELHPIVQANQKVLSPFVSRHCITSQAKGDFQGLKIAASSLYCVDSISLATNFGSEVGDDGTSKVAVIIASFDDKSSLVNFVKNCKAEFGCEIHK